MSGKPEIFLLAHAEIGEIARQFGGLEEADDRLADRGDAPKQGFVQFARFV